jgi:hypothetical protein
MPSNPPRREDGGTPPPCDTSVIRSAVRREIAEITQRYEQADRRAKAAPTVEDREAAETERRDIAGEFWAANEDLASFGVLLLRLGEEHYPDALRDLLVKLLRPELQAFADAIARLEGRRS